MAAASIAHLQSRTPLYLGGAMNHDPANLAFCQLFHNLYWKNDSYQKNVKKFSKNICVII
jgi:hypothetical protein